MWLYSKAWIVLPALLVNQLWLILVLMRVLPQLSYVLLLKKWQGMKKAIRRLQRLVYHSDSDSDSFLPIKARLPKHRKDLGGAALTLPLDDPRRRNPSDQYGLESHEAIRPNGNERGGGRERLWEWSQQRNTLDKRRDDAEARVAEWNTEIAEYGKEEARAR